MSKNCTKVRAADYFSSFNQSDHCFLVSSLPSSLLKSGFHIVVSVVSVVSVVRKKFIGQIKLYGNLPYKCSIQKPKWQIQLFVRDRMNSIRPMNFFRTTDTTDTTDTTIWKPGFMETSRTTAEYKRNDRYNLLYEIEWILSVLWIFFVRQTRHIRQIQRYGNQALSTLMITIDNTKTNRVCLK